MLLSAVARYRGAVHGRLPIACGTFKGDLLIAVAGYAAAGEIQFFEPLENTKVLYDIRPLTLCLLTPPVFKIKYKMSAL